MAAYLTLYVDWYNRKLVNGLTDPGAFTIPARTQGEVLPMKVYLVKPNAGGRSYSQENVGSMALKLAVANAPEATPFVTAYSWTKDTSDGNGFFTTEVDFNTASLDTWLDGEAYKTAYIELEITEGTAVSTIYRRDDLRINATTVPASDTTVTAGQTPLSLEVADQKYAAKVMENGETIMLKSSDGAYGMIFGVNTDGSVRQEIVQLT